MSVGEERVSVRCGQRAAWSYLVTPDGGRENLERLCELGVQDEVCGEHGGHDGWGTREQQSKDDKGCGSYRASLAGNAK